MPLVFVAHLVGTLLERSTDARLELIGQMTIGRYVQIPLLVIVHGLPTLVPIVLRHRLSGEHADMTVRTPAAGSL